jgi:hypothetical protein
MREITKTPKKEGQKARSFSKWAPSEHEPTVLLLTLVCMMPYNLRPLYGNVTNFVQGITGINNAEHCLPFFLYISE